MSTEDRTHTACSLCGTSESALVGTEDCVVYTKTVKDVTRFTLEVGVKEYEKKFYLIEPWTVAVCQNCIDIERAARKRRDKWSCVGWGLLIAVIVALFPFLQWSLGIDMIVAMIVPGCALVVVLFWALLRFVCGRNYREICMDKAKQAIARQHGRGAEIMTKDSWDHLPSHTFQWQ